MFLEALWITTAFAFGLIAKKTGLPPLLGYLVAGFAITFGLNHIPETVTVAIPLLQNIDPQTETLGHLAHIGILLLLFTVGLKIKVKQVVQPVVIVTGLLHTLFSVAVFAPVVYFLFEQDIRTSFLIATALSFSSTVLAATVLESKQETRAFHGRIAIGILIVQDVVAMVVMSASSGSYPSPWALLLLGLIAAKPLLHKLLDHSGHDEMLLLCGLGLALVIGGMGFSAFGLSGELGALVIGALCASHPKSSELAKTLWGLKEVFLVAFFLTIGLNGLPTSQDILFAAVVTAFLPLQGLAFFALLIWFKLKSRTAFLTSTSLTNFSEFSLIVAAIALPEWIVPLAIAVSFSFVLSAPLNRWAHPLFDKMEGFLSRFERAGYHPDEEPISIAGHQLLIMGMGRIGRSTYKATRSHYPEGAVIGFDSDADKITMLQERGYNAVYADAEHGNFWKTLDTRELVAVILAMDCPNAAMIATEELRSSGYIGCIIAHSKFQDEADTLLRAGVSRSYVTMEEVGRGLLANVLEHQRSKV
jgi:predicted Kef-type K+ transport protein